MLNSIMQVDLKVTCSGMCNKRLASKKLIMDRSLSLSKRHIDISAFPDDLAAAILGDYLQYKHPRKKIKAVETSASAASELMKKFKSPRPETLEIAESDPARVNDRAFWIMQLQLGKKLVKDRDDVFSQLWNRITCFWEEADSIKWAFAFRDVVPLGDVRWSFSDKSLEAEIVRHFENSLSAPFPIKHILRHHSFSMILSRVERFPGHPDHNVDAIIKKIESLLDVQSAIKRDPALCIQRRIDLEYALESAGSVTRVDSSKNKASIHDNGSTSVPKKLYSPYSEFIYGSTLQSVDEVVALTIFEEKLVAFGDEDEELLMHYIPAVESGVFEDGKDWITSVLNIANSSSFEEQVRNQVARNNVDFAQ